MHRLTAAHKRLPFGTLVEVTNLRNRRTVVVRITDRGPYGKGRIIDLSRAAAKQLGMLVSGVVPVRVKVKKWGQNCRTFHGRKSCRPVKRLKPRPKAKRPRSSAKRPRARPRRVRKRVRRRKRARRSRKSKRRHWRRTRGPALGKYRR